MTCQDFRLGWQVIISKAVILITPLVTPVPEDQTASCSKACAGSASRAGMPATLSAENMRGLPAASACPAPAALPRPGG